MTAKMFEEFSSQDVDALRRAAQPIRTAIVDADEFEEPRKQGRWRQLRGEAEDLLALFPALSLRPGYELRAYAYRDFWGGHSALLAGKQGAQFPEPDDAEAPREGNTDRGLSDSFMEAISADGSPRGYLEASIFAREAAELGAFWHGLSWGNETVLGGDPWSRLPRREPLAPLDQWAWILDRPSSFEPSASQHGQRSWVVRFFSHDPVGLEMLHANVDLYPGGDDLHCARYRAPMAIGPAGVIP